MVCAMTDRNTHDAPLTVDEVATMHRVSRRTVERWIKNGDLPAAKLPGGLVRIEPADARALLTPTGSSRESAA